MKRVLYIILYIILFLLAIAYIAPKPAFAQTTSFLDNFDGAPGAPTPFNNPRWTAEFHNRSLDGRELSTMTNDFPQHNAMHGQDCAPPLATFDPRGDPRFAVYQCRNHVMTTLLGSPYAATYLTPNHMVDFSQNEAVIKWDLSTARASGRDWWDVWITPWNDHLAMPLQPGFPDLNGPPKNAIHLLLNICCTDNLGIEAFVGGNTDPIYPTVTASGPTYFSNVVTPSATVRSPFELRLTRTTYKLFVAGTMLEEGRWNSPLPFSSGLVQFGHHSYSPEKGCGADPRFMPSLILPCNENTGGTWHWDTVSINPAIPMTIIKTDKMIVVGPGPHRVNFNAPAPTGARLRFSGVGAVSLSFGGAFTPVTHNQVDYDAGHASSYWVSVPAGATFVDVRLAGDGWFQFNDRINAKGFSVWSQTAGVFPTTPPGSDPLPTATPTNTPTPRKLGDVDGNGTVDIFDFNEVVGFFGRVQTNPHLDADLDKDGDVDIFDFNEVVANFGR